MKYIMAIDFGTSAIKTAVFNESGELKISKTSEYSLIYGDKGIIEISLKELQRAFDFFTFTDLQNVLLQMNLMLTN